MIDQGIETDLMIEEEIDLAPDQGIDITEEMSDSRNRSSSRDRDKY